MEISDLIKTGVKTGLLGAYVSYPGIVESFNPTEQTITAQIAIQRIVDGKNESISVLVGVPLVFPTVSGFHITLPIKPNDEVLIVFADRCIDGWWLEGKTSPQMTLRVHDIADGFAIIGVNSKPNTVENYNPDDLEIRNTANNQKIALTASGDINIETTGNINAACSSLSATANDTTITAPTNTINGNLDVSGTITAPTVIASTNVNSPIVSAGASLTVGGVEMGGHTHGGVQSGTSNTSPPN